jgi:hypothetical protein
MNKVGKGISPAVVIIISNFIHRYTVVKLNTFLKLKWNFVFYSTITGATLFLNWTIQLPFRTVPNRGSVHHNVTHATQHVLDPEKEADGT